MKNHYFTLSIKGFTLIELLLVMMVIGLIASLGVSTFVNYSKKTTFDQVVANYVNTLNTAKAKSYSGVRPTDAQCNNKTLIGYGVRISAPSQYVMVAMCDNTPVQIGNTTTLPSNITISYTPNPPKPIIFQVLSGAVSQNGNTTITGNGFTKIITVSSYGVIKVQ